jgi:hypothetical protein
MLHFHSVDKMPIFPQVRKHRRVVPGLRPVIHRMICAKWINKCAAMVSIADIAKATSATMNPWIMITMPLGLGCNEWREACR